LPLALAGILVLTMERLPRSARDMGLCSRHFSQLPDPCRACPPADVAGVEGKAGEIGHRPSGHLQPAPPRHADPIGRHVAGSGPQPVRYACLIDTNISKELRDNLPDRAPAFFFLDVHSTEAEQFTTALNDAGASSVSTAPMLRGRIVKVNGVPSNEVKVSPDAAWALRGDRGITYSATAPENAELSEGQVVGSGLQRQAAGFVLRRHRQRPRPQRGDTVTVNVLGREITAEVANLREVDWRSLQINFVMMFSPNTFAGAPHMYVITAQADEAAEPAILKAVSSPFPTVTSIRVRDALDAINKLMGQLITAIRGANAMTLLVGILVLGGALATGLSGRIYDAVILKTYGATRRQLLRSLVIEYAALGLATATFAIVAGSLSAWAIITFIMDLDWQFSFFTAAVTALLALVVTVAAGLITTWSALRASPARVLRVD
jgi:putative ABC transport system permease protein